MKYVPKNPFDLVESRKLDALVLLLSGSNNRSKIQAVKKALWLSLFIKPKEAEWFYEELKKEGFKDPV